MIPYLLAAVGGYLIGQSQKRDIKENDGRMMADGGMMDADSTKWVEYKPKWTKAKSRMEKEKADAEYKKNLASANARYESLHRWLSNLPKHPSRGDNPGNPGDAESKPEDIIGELSRANGNDLAEYSLKTETLRLGLLACYAQYDSVKEKLDKLRLENASKIE